MSVAQQAKRARRKMKHDVRYVHRSKRDALASARREAAKVILARRIGKKG